MSPQTISYKRIPRLQTVAGAPWYLLHLIHSGGAYTRVPVINNANHYRHWYYADSLLYFINGKFAIFNDVVRDKNHEGITKHLNNDDKLAGENIYLAHTHNVFWRTNSFSYQIVSLMARCVLLYVCIWSLFWSSRWIIAHYIMPTFCGANSFILWCLSQCVGYKKKAAVI